MRRLNLKKLLIIAAAIILMAGVCITAFQRWQDNREITGYVTDKDRKEFAAVLGLTNAPAQPVLAPLELSQPIRLAIGGLGLADKDQDQQLGDLVTVKLTGAVGFTLVERQSIDAILRELNLSLHGFVRAKDAVRAGKLLKADWFLFGTEATINGENSIVIRVVDARTGVVLDAGVLPFGDSQEKLASNLALFMQQTRENAAKARLRVYLAIGAFEDLSVNNRRADFPNQLRGYLVSAYRGSGVTLLERESVETLLQEVRLDLAGLTEDGSTKPPRPMQSAFWLVTGQYQSYETTNLQLELNFEVRRMFGAHKDFTLRGPPDDSICRRLKASVDEMISRNSDAITPSRVSEARAQFLTGRQLANPNATWNQSFFLTAGENYMDLDEQEAARQRRNAEEAIRSFETVLLLDSGNREARLYLAACLRKQVIGRVDDARKLYREVLEEPVQDKWTQIAQAALGATFGSPDEKLRWFSMALEENTNPAAAEFYKQNKDAAETEALLQRGEGPMVGELAEKQLFEKITATSNFLQGGSGTCYGDSAMSEFVHAYDTNRPTDGVARLAELYPRMKTEFPQLAPYLLEWIVYYQTDTNSPLVAELEQAIDWEMAHPDQVYEYNQVSFERSLYLWCMDKKLYRLALKALDRDRRVNGRGKTTQLGDQDRIAMGYAYLGMEKWKDAMETFECLSNRPVVMRVTGPWGRGLCPVSPGRLYAFCREKLGLTDVHDPLEFDLGKPLAGLPLSETFTVDNNGLWVGMNGCLMQIDYNLKTHLRVQLPMGLSTRISSICVSSSNIWVGTFGDGLFEYDKQKQTCRHFTLSDGLLMNDITALSLSGNSLWIGYGHEFEVYADGNVEPGNGGLGCLDLSSHKFTSFTPSIVEGVIRESSDQPTRLGIRALAVSPAGQAWFATVYSPLRRYRVTERDWRGFSEVQRCSSLVTDHEHLFAGTYGNYFGTPTPGALGIWVLDFKDGQWRELKAANHLLPGVVTTLALDQNNLWVGGLGYIAQVDPIHDQVLHFAFVKSPTVDRLQIGGGYLWAQFEDHLYRAPLNALRYN